MTARDDKSDSSDEQELLKELDESLTGWLDEDVLANLLEELGQGTDPLQARLGPVQRRLDLWLEALEDGSDAQRIKELELELEAQAYRSGLREDIYKAALEVHKEGAKARQVQREPRAKRLELLPRLLKEMIADTDNRPQYVYQVRNRLADRLAELLPEEEKVGQEAVKGYLKDLGLTADADPRNWNR